MNGYLSPFDSLLDELRRWEREPFPSPWLAGIRSTRQGTFPPLNVGASEESVDVYVFAAGLDTDSLDLSLRQNLLTIAGQRRLEAEENASYYRQERFSGSFRRVLTLPEDVDPDDVKASYRDGVLHVRVGRREAARPRRIEVH